MLCDPCNSVKEVQGRLHLSKCGKRCPQTRNVFFGTKGFSVGLKGGFDDPKLRRPGILHRCSFLPSNRITNKEHSAVLLSRYFRQWRPPQQTGASSCTSIIIYDASAAKRVYASCPKVKGLSKQLQCRFKRKRDLSFFKLRLRAPMPSIETFTGERRQALNW